MSRSYDSELQTRVVVVKKILFNNKETGWTIALAEDRDLNITEEMGGFDTLRDRPLIKLVGLFPPLYYGMILTVTGNEHDDPQYGAQFKVRYFSENGFATSEATFEYLLDALSNYVWTKLIHARYGKRSVEVLDNEFERVRTELANDLSEPELDKLQEVWNNERFINRISAAISQYDLGAHVAISIFANFGKEALTILETNPYRLFEIIEECNFDKCDKMAFDRGIKSRDPLRITAATYWALLHGISEGGHCYIPAPNLLTLTNSALSKTKKPIQIGRTELLDALRELHTERRIYADSKSFDDYVAVYPYDLYVDEKTIAENLVNRLQMPMDLLPENIEIPPSDIEYTDEQLAALKGMLCSRVGILTGGPGRGKTTVCKGLLDYMEAKRKRVIVVSPTAAGAKRFEEVNGFPAQTIHRKFKFAPNDALASFSFFPEEIFDNVDAIVLEEASMVGTPLFAGVLRGVGSNVQIWVVGDGDQLPSVESGDLLADLKAADVPYFELKEPHRFARDSEIIQFADDLNNGRMPKLTLPCDYTGGEVLFIPRDNKRGILIAIGSVIEKILIPQGYDLEDMQLLCPRRQDELGLGTETINNDLRPIFNRNAIRDIVVTSKVGTQFSYDDRVIQIKNNRDKDVYNGDIGKFQFPDTKNKTYSVAYPFLENNAEYKAWELEQIRLGYAITVHKAQGKEMPVVILLAHNSFGRNLLTRSVYYTGSTRAKSRLIIIGQESAIRTAVNNDKRGERWSGLVVRMKQASI